MQILHSMSSGTEDPKGIDRKTVARVWSFSTPYRRMVVGFIVLIVLGTVIGLIPTLAFRDIIDTAIENKDRSRLNWLGLLVVISASRSPWRSTSRSQAATRRWGAGMSWGRVLVTLVFHAVAYLLVLAPDWGRSIELFAIGMVTAAGMEVPLFILKIRPGAEAWKATVLNTLVEWNYAAPILLLLFHYLGWV